MAAHEAEPELALDAKSADDICDKEQLAKTNHNVVGIPDSESSDHDATLVSFHVDHDKADPKNWARSYKWLIIFLLSGLSLTSNLAVLVCAPAIPAILSEFGRDGDSPEGTLLVTIWNLGATVGCFFVGPLSEVYGRLPVYHTANVLYLLTLVAQSQSVNIGMALAFRCLNGLMVASYALNPGIVGDLFCVEDRGRAQSMLSLMPLLGPVIGPIAGGWISQVKGWRWSFWFTFFVFAAWALAFAVCYRETYDVQILRRRARKMREQTGDITLRSAHDHTSLSKTLRRALLRPLRAFTVPVFLLLTIPACIVEGYSYLLAANISNLYETEYGFSPGADGLVFIGLAIGMIASVLFCSFFLDWYTKRMKQRHNGEIKAEWRLPPMVLGFISSPAGLFLYGWATEKHAQYVVPIVGTALCGFATFIIMVPMTTYLVDAFGTHRASGISAMQVLRNALTTVEPLIGPPLARSIGLGWGSSTLAFVAIALAPFPILLLYFGERLRKRSKLESWS